MQEKNLPLRRNISQVYLILVPILTAILGIAVGHIPPRIYLPVWMINVCLMITASWVLASPAIRTREVKKQQLVICSLLLIIPWMFISLFFGLGAPPFGKPVVWMATVTEQQTRYYFLLVAGVCIVLGFAVLREKLKKTEGDFYSRLGFIMLQTALPLFLINMTFWGWYIAELYRMMVASGLEKTPDWVLPVAKQFYFINILVAAFIYLATAAFAASLKKAGWFNPAACHIYMLISFLSLLLDLLPFSLPEPMSTVNYIVSIPAIPFMMPYFMGVNLLRKTGAYLLE